MAKKQIQPHVIEEKPTDHEPIGNLLLDGRNPRFFEDESRDDQDELVKRLWKGFGVIELVQSIAANGFFAAEPLFVIPAPNKNGHDHPRWIVVEGNRRLAAARILLEEDLRTKLKITSAPTLTSWVRATIEALPIKKYGSREDLWPYLGFRHINGAQPWDSFSKAQYVAGVYENEHISKTLDEIATSIGDAHSTVKRLYRGINLLQQAEKVGVWNRDDRQRGHFNFSHLYTAADQPEYQNFLGLNSENSLEPNPVKRVHLKDLGQLMIWLFGSKTQKLEPIVQSQNPDLNLLREVLGKRSALAALRAGIPLKKAHEISVGDERRFKDALIRAKEDLTEAHGTVVLGYSGQEDVAKQFDEILRLTEAIRLAMAQTSGPKSIRSRNVKGT